MPPDPEAPFPPDYRTARKAFIAACVKAHADTISRAHMGRSGPDGKPVFVDSIALGARDAKRAVLVIANDVHASIAITTLLQDGLAVSDGNRLVVVHALDPFSFMHMPGDPAWSQAMLKAIATEDLSHVTELVILAFGPSEDELPAIFPPDRKVRLIRKHADAPFNAAQMCKIVKREIGHA
ncbi:MAG: DUF2817 domain-containing protein [Pseudomonadota bacterium]